MEGSKELQNALKEIRNDAFKKKVLTSVYRKAAKPFVKTARANAPIADEDVKIEGGEIIKRGFLRKSIKTWVSRGVRSPHLFMGVKLSKDQKKKKSYWYFVWLELGTVHQAAKPFLQPAWNATIGPAAQIMQSEFSAIFQKFKTKYGIK